MNKACLPVSSMATLAACSLGLAGLSGCATDQTASSPQSAAVGNKADATTLPVASAASCVEPATGLPNDVFCTGLYAGGSATQYNPDARPYTPGVTLWSDGAEKQRYLYLPPGGVIDTSQVDAWKFPVGTKAWKEFRFDGKLVETRLFWKRDDTTWESGTYIWNSDQTVASLNSSRKPLLLSSGYEIPTAKDCGKCHHGGSDKLLGVEAVALALPTARGLTLASLASTGALSAPPNPLQIDLPEDSTGLGGAALGYLHANCGMPCHSSRGLGHETELLMRLRADEIWPANNADAAHDATATQSYRALVNQPAVTGAVTNAFPEALRITPGDHMRSLVWLLANRRGDYQMPPLVSHRVDEKSMQTLAAWIDALKAP